MKVRLLRVRRSIQNARETRPKLTKLEPDQCKFPIAESVTRLWTSESEDERRLECGKVHNLRVAAKLLDGLIVPAEQTFSFWRIIGKPTKSKGFVQGRQVQEGCIIASIGGGLCQLSNSLFDVATKAGLEIIERHPHTMIVPGSAAEYGRDATVAWNHIDLRFRAKTTIRLTAKLTADSLVVQVFADAQSSNAFVPILSQSPGSRKIANSCETCGQEDCFRHMDQTTFETASAWLLDSVWPEFDLYLNANKATGDQLLTPIGRPFHVPARFQWSDHPRTDYANFVALQRAMKLRNVAGNGPERRAALLHFEECLAKSYAKKLDFSARHLSIDLSLLPHLWKIGALGGREFSVLATRWPLAEIHRRFDEASLRFPDRGLLADFRAPKDIVEAETVALGYAKSIVTPHPGIATLFGSRAVLIPWQMEKTEEPIGKDLVFLGPTIARKGCYEVRDAVKDLGMPLWVGGREFEGQEFWNGVQKHSLKEEWLSSAGIVIAPSILEDQPRMLLKAFARGIPIITTRESGIPNANHVRFVEFGDADMIRGCLSEMRLRAES